MARFGESTCHHGIIRTRQLRDWSKISSGAPRTHRAHAGGRSYEWTTSTRDTERTTRRWVRGDHRDEQTVFGDLDLINQHPFRKRQKWSPFQHTLASQAKLHSRDFSWKGAEHVLSLYGKKKRVSGFTKSGHEPTYVSNDTSNDNRS
jgi:hypothetical protein